MYVVIFYISEEKFWSTNVGTCVNSEDQTREFTRKINILPIKGGNFGKDKELACFVIVQLFHLLDVLCSFEIF